MFGIDSILSLIGKTIDKIFPDANEAARAKAKLAELAAEGRLEDVRQSWSVMLAEAQSADPWTSRARPSFLYVIYAMILAGIPVGILSVFNPAASEQIGRGLAAWLGAIPADLWTLFGVGYVGYSASRTVDKWKGGGR